MLSTIDIENVVIYSCTYAPNVILEILVSDLFKLENAKEVKKVYYYDNSPFPERETELSNLTTSNIDFDDCLSAVECEYMRDDHSLSGESIKIGLIEENVPSKTIPALVHLGDRYVKDPAIRKNASQRMQMRLQVYWLVNRVKMRQKTMFI